MGYAFNLRERECKGNVYYVNKDILAINSRDNLSKTTSLDSKTACRLLTYTACMYGLGESKFFESRFTLTKD